MPLGILRDAWSKTDARAAESEPPARFLTKLVRAVGEIADLELLEPLPHDRD